MPAAAHEPDDDEPAGLSHAPDAGQAAQKAGHSHEEQAQEQQAAVPAAKRQSKAAGAGTKRGGGVSPQQAQLPSLACSIVQGHNARCFAALCVGVFCHEAVM